MAHWAWLTDLHLEFVEPAGITEFFQRVADSPSDVVLISGDIAMAASFDAYLRRLEAAVRRPIYFVLGNHDFYGGHIAQVRGRASELSRGSPWLRWLPDAGVVDLDERTALVGHDSWGDGRLGRAIHSRMVLNDYFCINDFQSLTHDQYFARLGVLGDEAAAYFRDVLPRAFDRRDRVVLVTHVPPFAEASWHLGQTSDDDGLPHFACRAVGEALRDVMSARPQCRLTVLCGHTHSQGSVQVAPNIEVHTGGAEYGAPAIQPDVVLS